MKCSQESSQSRKGNRHRPRVVMKKKLESRKKLKKDRENARQAVRRCREKKKLQLRLAKESISTLKSTLEDLNGTLEKLDEECDNIERLYKSFTKTHKPQEHFDLTDLTHYDYAG